MPFSDDFDPVYQAVRRGVSHAIPDVEVECFWLKELRRPTRITDDILQSIQEASVCIADVTGCNPNVMWETGYAMALDKPTILLGQDVDKLPFDLMVHRVLPYSPSHLRTLGRAVAAAFVSALSQPVPPALPGHGYSYRAPGGRDTIELFESSNAARSAIEAALMRAHEVKMVGTGINVLQDDDVRRRVFRRVRDGGLDLTVCMANPDSRFVEARLFEEELGDVEPGVGAQGVRRLLHSLCRAEAQPRSGEMHTLMFNHYPTMCVIKADDDLFVYPYGHCTLGNHSPTFRIHRPTSPLREYFDEQMDLLLWDAVPARELLEVEEHGWAASAGWPRFAVYLIPPGDHPLYRRGSAILGYDVRGGSQLPLDTKLGPWVGEARNYGLHMTIGDALVAQTPQQIDWIGAELRALAAHFTPFELTKPRFSESLLERGMVGIEFDDESGVVEALHAEVVVRLNVQAVGSHYTIPGHPQHLKTRPGRKDRRATMLGRYKAPYVLSRFHAHITLLGGIKHCPLPPDKLQAMLLDRLGLRSLEDMEPIPIDDVNLMRLGSDQFWEIDPKYVCPLG